MQRLLRFQRLAPCVLQAMLARWSVAVDGEGLLPGGGSPADGPDVVRGRCSDSQKVSEVGGSARVWAGVDLPSPTVPVLDQSVVDRQVRGPSNGVLVVAHRPGVVRGGSRHAVEK